MATFWSRMKISAVTLYSGNAVAERCSKVKSTMNLGSLPCSLMLTRSMVSVGATAPSGKEAQPLIVKAKATKVHKLNTVALILEVKTEHTEANALREELTLTFLWTARHTLRDMAYKDLETKKQQLTQATIKESLRYRVTAQ